MSINEEINHLNPEQKKAVQQVTGRVLILAGAGSGKTRVLTLRMAHLIHHLNVSAKSILGLTFTNKAAAEMRHRLASFVGVESAKQATLSTFHSFCMQVLRQDIELLGYTRHFSLYDEMDTKRLMQFIARDLLEHEGELPSLAATMDWIRQAKNSSTCQKAHAVENPTWHDGFAKEVYERMQSSMRAYNAVDFDRLLELTVELFEKFPSVLERYQERYRYLMIDEYQDTNPIQYRLASLLSSKYNHLCVVGDDDQSIYGWRGADVKNILEFDRALVIKLEQNYRSTNVILQAANALIRNNLTRHDKVLWSDKGQGRLIDVFHAPDEVEEAASIVKRMLKMKDEGLSWSDMAILYRSNALSRQVEQALLRCMWKKGDKWIQGIPYEVYGGTEFYDRKEVKDLCAYLRFIVNPHDEEALLRIINQPRRGIGDESLDVLTAFNRKEAIPLWDVLNDLNSKALEINSKAKKGIEQFITIIEEAKSRFCTDGLADSLRWLVEKIDYQKAVREEVKSQQMRDFKNENIEEFITSLADFEEESKNHDELEATLSSFVANFTLNNQLVQANKKKKTGDCVRLMTFHSSKGLEFPACFLVGIEDHIIPHEKSMLETGVEEERRLMYVAITRAKKYLTISMAKQRKRLGKEMASKPSRFLFEIPKELLALSDWRQAPLSTQDLGGV